MAQSKFKVGDTVTIIENDLQPAMVGKKGKIKKVYPLCSCVYEREFVYRIEVDGETLKGVAMDKDLK